MLTHLLKIKAPLENRLAMSLITQHLLIQHVAKTQASNRALLHPTCKLTQNRLGLFSNRSCLSNPLSQTKPSLFLLCKINDINIYVNDASQRDALTNPGINLANELISHFTRSKTALPNYVICDTNQQRIAPTLAHSAIQTITSKPAHVQQLVNHPDNNTSTVPETAAIAGCHFLKEQFNLQYDITSGSNFFTCLELIQEMRLKNQTGSIVIMASNNGAQTENTIYNHEWLKRHNLRPQPYLERMRDFYYSYKQQLVATTNQESTPSLIPTHTYHAKATRIPIPGLGIR